MTKDIVNGILLFIALVLPLLGVFVFGITDVFVDKRRKRFFAILAILVFTLIIQNFSEYYLIENYNDLLSINVPLIRTFVSFYGYSVRPVIIVLFVYLVNPRKIYWPLWVVAGINLLIHTTMFYSHLSIWFDETGFNGGPLRYTCLIVSILLLLSHIAVVIYEFRAQKKKVLLVPMVLTLLVVAGMVLDIFSNWRITHRVDYITLTIVASTVIYYIWLHIQFVYKHENDLLAEQKIQIALSQIKPHFIYNSLNAIKDIEGNPEKTQQAIVDFAAYLRENLDSLTSTNLISFKKELEHVQKYIALEKLRFEDKINIEFDIECDDFFIPSLTLQMVVENAIKHGITKKYEGGTVKVSSRKIEDCFVVEVEDDGVGFDVSKTLSSGHLGLRNTKERLDYYVKGTLEITSEIDVGTKVTIKIPVKAEDKE